MSGAALTPLLPVTGATLVSRSAFAADAVVNIAEKDERVFKALVAALKYGAWAQLAMFGGVVALAVAVDAGSIEPQSMVAQRLLGKEIEAVLDANERRRAETARAEPEAPSWAAESTG